MTHMIAAGTIAAGAIVFTFADPGVADAKAPPSSFADLAERLSPAVVNIATTQTVEPGRRPDIPQLPPGSPFKDFFDEFFDRDQPRSDRPRRAQSLGSGFIIDSVGIVVTNNHVIADADEITVRLQDDTEFKAELLGTDPKTDIAVLRIDPAGRDLPSVSFGDSDGLRVGDWVVAIGNPFGLGGTVTAGIVSARGRDIGQGPYDDFIQTDASINRGNSGGPLFNMDGDVIGINTAIFSQSGGSVGIGFAISSELAKNVVSQLREFGRTRRGWLGVQIQQVTDEIAESLGLEQASGALVAAVTPGGPAESSGIKAGDIILEFNGQNVEEMRALPRIVAETPVGEEVAVMVWRDGKPQAVTATLGELEKAEEARIIQTSRTDGVIEDTKVSSLGLDVATLTPQLRDEYQVPGEVDGIVIREIAPDGVAAEKGLAVGDVIVEANQKDVREPQDLADAVAEARDAGKKSILLFVASRGETRFIALRIDKG
jgi:serine protease Do